MFHSKLNYQKGNNLIISQYILNYMLLIRDIPSSFNGLSGKIVYKLFAIIRTADGSEHKVKREIHILAPITDQYNV